MLENGKQQHMRGHAAGLVHLGLTRPDRSPASQARRDPPRAGPLPSHLQAVSQPSIRWPPDPQNAGASKSTQGSALPVRDRTNPREEKRHGSA